VLGIISLMGILVRNGIIMLDYAEELRQVHKMSVFDAALQEKTTHASHLPHIGSCFYGGSSHDLGKKLPVDAYGYGHFLWNADFHGISGNGITGSLLDVVPQSRPQRSATYGR